VEDVIYAILCELKSGPKPRDALLKVKVKGWEEQEIRNILDTMVQTKLVGGEKELQITPKGKFFWKRVHRKKQGFLEG